MGTDPDPAPTDRSPNGGGRPEVASPRPRDTGPGRFDRLCWPLILKHSRVFEVENPTTIRFHPVNCCMNRQNLHLPIKINQTSVHFLLLLKKHNRNLYDTSIKFFISRRMHNESLFRHQRLYRYMFFLVLRII